MIEAEWFDEEQGIYCKPGGWYKTCTRATPADVDRMWRRLWGDMTKQEIAEANNTLAYPRENGVILDLCEGLQINERK